MHIVLVVRYTASSWARLTVLSVFLAAAPPQSDARTAAPEAVSPPCANTPCLGNPEVFDHWDEAGRILYGYGITARDDQAIRWYRKAAEAGDTRAMHNLGLMLVEGTGAVPDMAEGKKWLYESLERGAAESALALGNMARLGIGQAPDAERAAAFYRTGAERGDARAMLALGNLHAQGLGTPASMSEAFFWYYVAAERGYSPAKTAMEAALPLISTGDRSRTVSRAVIWEAERKP